MSQKSAMARLNFRVPTEAKNTIDRAASLQGRSRADFLLEAALEKAQKVIASHDIITLTARDQKILADSLLDEKIVEPTPFVKEILNEYKERARNEPDF